MALAGHAYVAYLGLLLCPGGLHGCSPAMAYSLPGRINMCRRDGMKVRPLASAEIVAVGTEILLGSLLDPNTAWLSQRLAASGVAAHRHTAVGDDRGRLSSRPFRRPPPGRT